MVLRRWGGGGGRGGGRVIQDNLVLSTELMMKIVHRKEVKKLTFRALALRKSAKLLFVFFRFRQNNPKFLQTSSTDQCIIYIT